MFVIRMGKRFVRVVISRKNLVRKWVAVLGVAENVGQVLEHLSAMRLWKTNVNKENLHTYSPLCERHNGIKTATCSRTRSLFFKRILLKLKNDLLLYRYLERLLVSYSNSEACVIQ